MRTNPRWRNKVAAALVLLAALGLAACNIRTNERGEKKNVDINTPWGSLKVREEANPKDTGITLYPGATQKATSKSGDHHSADVSIDSSMFGLKVVALTFESEDAPEKLISFYRKELSKWGKVLECHGDESRVTVRSGRKGSDEVTCDKDKGTDTIELKAGTEDHQHVVAVKPRGKGSEFTLVYVSTRGKGETI
jgi:outer membrane lipopolysaccharide assembly protein LptE/RlpB